MLKAARLSGEDWWGRPGGRPCPDWRYAAFYLQTNSVVLLRSITSGCEGWVARTGLHSVIKEKCDIFIREARTRLRLCQTGDLLFPSSVMTEPDWWLR